MLSKSTESVPLIDSSTGTQTINYELDLTDTHSYKVPTEELFPVEITVYKRRWWILYVFCFSSASLALSYVTWNALSDSLLIAYDWSTAQMGMISATVNIGVVISALPVMYMVIAKGNVLCHYMSIHLYLRFN